MKDQKKRTWRVFLGTKHFPQFISKKLLIFQKFVRLVLPTPLLVPVKKRHITFGLRNFIYVEKMLFEGKRTQLAKNKNKTFKRNQRIQANCRKGEQNHNAANTTQKK